MNDFFYDNMIAFSERYGIDLSEMYDKVWAAGDLNDSSMAFYDNAFARAAEEAKGIDPECKLLNFVTGFADGTFIRKMLGGADKISRIIVYEPDSASFIYLCMKHNISDLISDERLTIVVYDEDDEKFLIREIEKSVQFGNINSIFSMIVPAYNDMYIEIFNVVNDRIKKCVKELSVNLTTINKYENMFCRNELYALSTLSDNSCIDILLERIGTTDIPVIIVGAGPSLDKNAAVLKKAKGKALVIAASHTAPIFWKMGVTPDLYAVLDPKNDGFLDTLKDSGTKILCCAKGDKHSQESFRGSVIYYCFSGAIYCFPGYSRLYENIEHGGSVMTYLYSILRDAGFKRVIMAGMDLAFGETGNTHLGAENTAAHKRGIIVPGYHGGTVETREDWYSFLEFFEEQIKKHPELEVIDATEGGALIKGSVQMSLEEAIDMYCTDTLPISSWLKDLPATLSETEMSELKCYMRKKAECLSELTDDIRIATECGEKILQELDTGRDLSDIDPVMLNRYDEVYDTIINSEKATLLIYYCGDILMNYITEALKFEKSGDVRAKVKMEQQLFGMFGEKIPELVSYINELF